MSRRKPNAIDRSYREASPRRPGLSDEEVAVQFSGVIAKFDGICNKCGEAYLKGQSRIVRTRSSRGGDYAHVTCTAGFDE